MEYESVTMDRFQSPGTCGVVGNSRNRVRRMPIAVVLTLWIFVLTASAQPLEPSGNTENQTPSAQATPREDFAAFTIHITMGTKPIANAQVLIAKPGSFVFVNNGKFTGDAWEGSQHGARGAIPQAKTKRDGSCNMPEIDGHYIVAVVHESGYAVVNGDELHARNNTIALTPWTIIKGTMKLSGVSCPKMSFGASHAEMFDGDGLPNNRSSNDSIEIDFTAHGKTDDTSRFEIACMPAGHAAFYPTIYSKDDDSETAIVGLSIEVTTKVGQVTNLKFGEHGTTLTGKFGPDESVSDWTMLKATLHLEAPHIGFPVDDRMWKAQAEFAK